MTFRKAHFASGHDLKDFADKLGIELQARGCRAVTREAPAPSTSVRRTSSARIVFRVEIPAARNEPVVIVEDYGYRGQEGGIPRDEERVVLEAPGLVGDRRHRPPRVQRPAQGRQGRYRPLAHRHEPGGPAAGQGAVRAGLGCRDGHRRAAPGHLQQVGGAAPGGALVALRHDRGRGGPARGHPARLAACAVSCAFSDGEEAGGPGQQAPAAPVRSTDLVQPAAVQGCPK